jgi:hemerythrin-like metal-binding protein
MCGLHPKEETPVKFANLTISVKIYLGFLMILVIFMISSGYLILQIGTLGELQDTGAKRTEDALAIKDITNRVEEVYALIADAIINRDLNATRKDFAALKTNADRDIQLVLKLVDTAEEQALAGIFSTQYHNYLDLFEKQMLPILEKSPDPKIAMAPADEQKIRELDDVIDTLREATKNPLVKINTSLTQETQQADQLFDLIRRGIIDKIIIIALLGLGIAAFIAFLIARAITRPLGVAITAAGLITAGDLTTDIQVTSHDETGQLLQAMKTMAIQLREIVGNVTQATTQVSSAAAEIAQGSADLSQRTEEQASALEETASSMEELTSTVKQSADNAGQANSLASAARTQAEQGGQVVDQAITAMSAINQSSRRIADIISVIDEIAFQTNLLALNAAVEAARAGEQGRGFAVVAGEVRKLAQRSADAAKEIKGLITDSVRKVEDGGKLVEHSGQTLKEIVTSVKKVSDIVAEMAAAAREQATGIEQVNKAILQMDQVTQQNAALVEETASASQAMGGQAHELQRLMEFFTLDQSSLAANRTDAATSTATVRPRQSRPAVLPASGLARRRSEVQPAPPMTTLKSRATGSSGKATFFEWSEALSVGDSTIDRQHQRLIQIINKLHDAMRNQTAKAMLGELLEQLIAYTDEHFSYEEGRLQACGYPHLVSHQRLHTELLGQVRDLQTKFNQGKRNMNMELMNFLKTWLTEHIQKTDKRYTSYLSGNA